MKWEGLSGTKPNRNDKMAADIDFPTWKRVRLYISCIGMYIIVNLNTKVARNDSLIQISEHYPKE